METGSIESAPNVTASSSTTTVANTAKNSDSNNKRKRDDYKCTTTCNEIETQHTSSSKLAALSLAALSVGGGLTWDAWFELVKNFHEREGHCRVPLDHLELGCPLGEWVKDQRADELTPEQAAKLEPLNFFGRKEKKTAQPWPVLFQKLERYKERFGHASVVYKWEEDPKLANWVTRQRTLFSQNKLSQERLKKLHDLGFVWRIQDDWLVMYGKLKEYKTKYGDCNVPQNWAENPKFGRWVSRQREAFKDGNLKDDRKVKLDELGFEWTLKGKFILVMLGMQDETFLEPLVPVGTEGGSSYNY